MFSFSGSLLFVAATLGSFAHPAMKVVALYSLVIASIGAHIVAIGIQANDQSIIYLGLNTLLVGLTAFFTVLSKSLTKGKALALSLSVLIVNELSSSYR